MARPTPSLGHWNHVYQRFAYWRGRGHQASAGEKKRPSVDWGLSRRLEHQDPRGLRRPGNPIKFKLTPGNASDTKELPGLVDGLACAEVLADKAYDSDQIVDALRARGIEAVIPPKANRKAKRHLTWNLFQRMKGFRRFTTCGRARA